MEDLIKSVFRGRPRKWYEGILLRILTFLIFTSSFAGIIFVNNPVFFLPLVSSFVLTLIIDFRYEKETGVIIEEKLKKLDLKSLVALYNFNQLNNFQKYLTLKVLNEIHPGWEKKIQVDTVEIQDNLKKDVVSIISDNAGNIDSDTLLSNCKKDGDLNGRFN